MSFAAKGPESIAGLRPHHCTAKALRCADGTSASQRAAEPEESRWDAKPGSSQFEEPTDALFHSDTTMPARRAIPHMSLRVERRKAARPVTTGGLRRPCNQENSARFRATTR
jgi:hypothetical protein